MAAKRENKTLPEIGDVPEFLGTIEDAGKRSDSETLIALIGRLTGEPPVIWGGSMVGFGRYHYRYDSGHEGDSFLVGFAPRKAEFSIYGAGQPPCPSGPNRPPDCFARLGKHRMGKGCLYVKRLSEIDLGVLEQLLTLSIEGIRTRYPGVKKGRSHRFRQLRPPKPRPPLLRAWGTVAGAGFLCPHRLHGSSAVRVNAPQMAPAHGETRALTER